MKPLLNVKENPFVLLLHSALIFLFAAVLQPVTHADFQYNSVTSQILDWGYCGNIKRNI